MAPSLTILAIIFYVELVIEILFILLDDSTRASTGEGKLFEIEQKIFGTVCRWFHLKFHIFFIVVYIIFADGSTRAYPAERRRTT